MRVLLVNPPMYNIVKSGISSFEDSFLTDNPLPPLGLMYLASYILKHTKHDVRISDLAVEDTLLRDLKEYNPDVVGITTTTLTLYDALQVARLCKLCNPKIITIIGGAHCSIYPEETASFKEIDFVVRGDGEISIVNILNKNTLDAISSINVIEDLDSLPFPARELLGIDKYHPVMSKGSLTTTMMTSRGCPFHCQFCYQPRYGKKWRARSAENVVAEMEEIVKLGINEIEIYDDTFTYSRERILKICDLILSKGLKVHWNIRTRVDCVDKEMLKVMSLAGCKRINYGIESVTLSVLKVLRKGFNLEQIKDAIKWTKEAGMEIQAYFMLGSPRETRAQMLDTIKFANKYIPDYAYYSITAPMPSTDTYLLGMREGRYNDYWREFARSPVADFVARFWDEDNKEELIKMFNYGYRSFYGRPKYVLRQIGKVRSVKEFTSKAKIAIKMFK